MGIATVTLVGNLTNDPRPNASGTLCNLRVAVNDRRKIDDEWTEVPGYYDVVALGKLAEICVRYLKKGSQVAVAGKLQWREWEKDDVKRQTVEILANEIQFVGARAEAEPSSDDADTGW